ncbi:hypothetical protein [Nocardia flavorosea]|uniref:Uncharacterized protein n=1 Tax=Nocardia flavorosea TaxID=53429 RepID=A0A846YGY5_9NOCA|nr:hypothetical protein [Nocardia flavorosea]NKY58193.1 hypothetical protein [Nocardia flavorosea]
MICPHCSGSLLRRERTDHRCSKCERKFALDPKAEPLGLHDLRLRSLTERLSAGRGLSATVTQLWYTAARRRLPDLDRYIGGAAGTWVLLTVLATYILCLLSGIQGWSGPFVFWKVLLSGVVVLAAGLVVIYACRPLFRQRTRIAMPVTAYGFRTDVIGRWVGVYGEFPPGILDEQQVPIPVIEQPRVALVCDDPSVRACLAANGIPQAYDMALADRIENAPAGIPVLLLHDASLQGFATARAARLALGERVRVLGLAPRAVLDNESAIRLRERPPAGNRISYLHSVGLTQQEIDWLADGWWSPIAAIPPARLIAVVTRAAEKLEDETDAERRTARETGFLTWPAA